MFWVYIYALLNEDKIKFIDIWDYKGIKVSIFKGMFALSECHSFIETTNALCAVPNRKKYKYDKSKCVS